MGTGRAGAESGAAGMPHRAAPGSGGPRSRRPRESTAVLRARLADVEEQLRQAQKMVAVGHLAGGVAHDFNNLLTAIIGHADLILARPNLDQGLSADAEAIVRSADRAADLTRQLLAFGRRRTLQPEVVDLNHVVETMEGLLHRLISEDITLATSVGPSPVLVAADPTQLQQVILNLALNARDAMPHGGALVIITAIDPSPVWGGSQIARLSVSDTGTGMDADTRSRAFEPFFTTKPTEKGTGLGLATVAAIVDGLGGSIELDSAPGSGTRATIRLPLAIGRVPVDTRRPAGSGNVIGHETVLVVEDDDAVRAVACRGLAEHGFRVLQAHDGHEALRLVGIRDRPIDALVTDIVLPRMSGQELARRLVTMMPNLRVLFMSGHSLGDDPMGALAAGAFLAKPFSADALARRVRGVLDGPAATPSMIAGLE